MNLTRKYIRSRTCLSGALSRSRFTSSDQAKNLKPFSEIPGPRGLPIVGSLFDMVRYASNAGDSAYVHQILLKYGPIVKLSVLGKTLVVVSSPDAAAKVFRAEGKYPVRLYSQADVSWIYTNAGSPPAIAFAVGEQWKHVRSLSAKQIVPQRVANYAPGLCEIGDRFMRYIRHKRDSDGVVEDVNRALVKWAFQGIGYMTLGEKLDTFDESKKDLQEFEKISLDYAKNVEVIVFAPPLYKFFPTKAYRDFKRATDCMYEKASHILKDKYDKMVEAINSGVVDEAKAISLMEQWLIEGKLTQKEILTLCCDMLAAGIETSSLTATFLLHELAKHPELQEELYQEVSSIVGDRSSISFDDCQKMTLVRCCIKEILRLQAPTTGTSRVIDEDIEIGGYHIPAKTQVIFSTYTASRNSKYVEDPTSFRPERWTRDSAESIDPFVSLPFGFGSRMCYGRRLVELELYILLSKLSQNFRLSTKQQSLKLVQTVFTRPGELVKINFIDRK
eukprot:Em0022g619a